MALFGFKKKEEEQKEVQQQGREAVPSVADSKETKVAPKRTRKSTSKDATAGRSYASVLVGPRITEKATFASENGAYVFDVTPSATKTEIKEAVQHYYKVKPRKIRVVTVPRKLIQSRLRGRFGVTAKGKKAYVYLKKGDTIEVI